MPANQIQTLALLSGKGGAGKTVIALTMCKILSEAGYKVMLVDCDTSTHGATYFFEAELGEQTELSTLISVSKLLLKDYGNIYSLFKSREGFWVIPSTLRPEDAEVSRSAESDEKVVGEVFETICKMCADEKIDTIIFDCQAGYSSMANHAVRFARRNLIVLEADAVSGAALRVLYLQLGNPLKYSNTWHIFNKLTEDERPAYDSKTVAIFFPGLPSIPFDSDVRKAFATLEIVSIASQLSAFGLGVLRIMRTLFPAYHDSLSKLEMATVGNWHEYITKRIEALQGDKDKIKYSRIEAKRKKRLTRLRLVTFSIGIVAAAVVSLSLLEIVGQPQIARFIDIISPNWLKLLLTVGGALIILGVGIWYFLSVRDLQDERTQDQEQEQLSIIESELSKYVTLLATDPRLREFERVSLTRTTPTPELVKAAADASLNAN